MRALSIHLTDLCNSECAFCVVASPFYTRDSVAYDDVVRFLEEHAGGGYGTVNLHGGEPTIHPRFIETLDLILALGYREIHLQTNGIRLADPDFARRLAERQVTKFIVSLHGDTAELHDGQTFTKGGFAKTIRGLENVSRLGRHIRTNTVITVQNLARLEAIAELACASGVAHLNFSALHPVGSAHLSRGRVMPSLRDIRPPLYRAIDVALGHGRQVTLEGFPYCTVDQGREAHHLTNEYRAIRLLVRGNVVDDYDTYMRVNMSRLGEPCRECPVREVCGGPYPEYVEYFGWDEFSPDRVPATLAETAGAR